VVQLLADRAVDAVLARQVGPKAAEALKAGGLKVLQVPGGTVRSALEAASRGDLAELS
jgi:predicted Fe-Mo cluster-binding NifX family protein